jgi:hypothetical protein
MKSIDKKFNVWRADANCNPIESTDKVYVGPSKRWIMKHIAYENGVKINHGDLIVRLPNGEMYCASEF